MKINKLAVLRILQERGYKSYDENNFNEMNVSMEIVGRTSGEPVKIIVVTFAGGLKEAIRWRTYIKKSREARIDGIIGDI